MTAIILEMREQTTTWFVTSRTVLSSAPIFFAMRALEVRVPCVWCAGGTSVSRFRVLAMFKIITIFLDCGYATKRASGLIAFLHCKTSALRSQDRWPESCHAKVGRPMLTKSSSTEGKDEGRIVPYDARIENRCGNSAKKRATGSRHTKKRQSLLGCNL